MLLFSKYSLWFALPLLYHVVLLMISRSETPTSIAKLEPMWQPGKRRIRICCAGRVSHPQYTLFPPIPVIFLRVPLKDTGAGALHSYQSVTLRIASQSAGEKITYYVRIYGLKATIPSGPRLRMAHTAGHSWKARTMAANNNAILDVTGDYYARARGYRHPQ
jgi:hypothetical protein